MLLLAAIPLGVVSGVMVVVGLATDERLTPDGWVLATTTGAFTLTPLVVGPRLLGDRGHSTEKHGVGGR
jgi:hypothetical protein